MDSILASDDASAHDEQGDAGEPSGPMRLCAVTRLERPIAELIRFVADPNGEIVPDLSGKLPGRGVWVTAERAAVDAAVKANVFARSLKRQVKMPDGLASRIEAQCIARAGQALSIANKAGLVITGYQQVEALVESGEAAALIHGSDAAEGGKDKLNRKFIAVLREKGRQSRILGALTIQQLSLAMGRSNVVHAALKPGGAAEKFVSEAGRLERYRSG